MSRVAVIGGGAAGMFAAIAAAQNGHQAELFEKNEKLGKKIYITGKGRCNLTNDCEMETLFDSICSNRKFLYSAFYGFSNKDTMDFFRSCGMPIKTERGNRVFPVSDHASDVISALSGRLKKLGVKVHLNSCVKEIVVIEEEQTNNKTGNESIDERDNKTGNESVNEKDNKTGNESVNEKDNESDNKTAAFEKGGKLSKPIIRIAGLKLSDGSTIFADAVIVATGGLSYPSTGSTGDGYRFARETGHKVTDLSPSLVPMTVLEEDAAHLQGLSLRNVSISIMDGKKVLYEEFGEMMFTHFGVTGPLILTASSQVQKQLKKHPLELKIDLKPALSLQQLDARILREFENNKNRQFKNALNSLYPAKLVPVIIERSGISPEKAVHDISREERRNLALVTKELSFTLTGLRGYNEAVITRGGVSVKDINPGTMESKLVKGLYFAGEVLDVDAVTGGFNLQIAWSTGYAAGMGVR